MEGPTTTHAYPAYLIAALWAIGAAAVLSLLLFLGGNPYPLWAAAFIVGMSVLFWASVYRREKFKRQGVDPPPPFFNSVFIEVVMMAVVTGFYGICVSLLIGGGLPEARRMGTFFCFLGGTFAYRRLRWPKESLRYDFYAGALALILSISVGLLVERVF